MMFCRADHRFEAQKIAKATWLKTTLANAAADYLAGYHSTVSDFLTSRRELEFRNLHEKLLSWTPEELRDYVKSIEHSSLLFLALMLTGACNANCSICFTNRQRRMGELEPDERDTLLHQARTLGGRYVYIPGEGEPTIDRGFWQLIKTCREIGLKAIIFTNGIVFSDTATCRRFWGISPKEAIRRLRQYPVFFYFKFWTTHPELLGKMMGIDPNIYHFTPYGNTMIHSGLARLLDAFPRSQLGIEVLVERRNADEVADVIVPFAERHGLARIVEMIQHNGRVFGNGAFDPSEDQVTRTKPLLSPTSCSMATCKAVITSRGYLSPRMGILENQIPGKPVDVRTGELFHLLHYTDYIVKHRYQINTCLCEAIPISLAAQGEPDVRACSPKVDSPIL